MLPRTTGAIALRPTGNVQGGYYFLSLTTGKRLSRFAWTALPMPDDAINRVHVLARRNPAGGDVQFGRRDGTLIPDTDADEDDLHDEDYVPDGNDSDDDDDDLDDFDPHPAGGVEEYADGDEEEEEQTEEGITEGEIGI